MPQYRSLNIFKPIIGPKKTRSLFFAAMLCGHCLTVAGCGGSIGPVRLQDTAEANYSAGIHAFKAKAYDKAIRYFEYVRSKFPFSKYSTLAELRVADSYFQNNEFGSAADAYKLFMRFHPNHVRSLDGYAAFQSARSQFKQIPGDFFILPPSYEKDQKSVGVAAQELRSFVGTYPNSQYYNKGYNLLQKCLKRRIDHELYVAKYYLKRKKTKSAIMRYNSIINLFPEAEDRPTYMSDLAALYDKHSEPKKAFAMRQRLLAKYPTSSAAQSALANDPSLAKNLPALKSSTELKAPQVNPSAAALTDIDTIPASALMSNSAPDSPTMMPDLKTATPSPEPALDTDKVPNE